MVSGLEKMVTGSPTKVSRPETTFLLTGKMVFVARKIFSFAQSMVSRIGTTVCAMQTIFTRPDTTVKAALTMVSVTQTVVCGLRCFGSGLQ